MIYNKDLEILRSLSCLAKVHKSHAGARICAAVVYKNEIIVVGFNKRKTHPLMLKFSKNKSRIFLHAETDAIKTAIKYLKENEMKKSSLYVCRVLKNGAWAISKPCEGCMNMIENFEINRIVYSCNGFESYISLPL